MSTSTGRARLALWSSLAFAAFAALLGLFSAAPAGAAEPVAISAGAGADWGVKASFRSYIAGPIANGSTEVSEGASINSNGTFHFPVASGSYDPETRSTVVQFSGQVHFSGHAGQLDLRIWNPRVEITPEGGALYAEVASRSLQEGASVVTYPNAKLADLDVDSVDPVVDSTTTTWTALPATLDEQGVEPFAGFYAAGTALDPFTFGYDGTGGKPEAEDWTAPGTPLLGLTAAGTVPAGVGHLAIGAGTVWASSYDGGSVSILDGETLATKQTIDVEGNPRNVVVDRGGLAGYTIDTSIRRISTATDPATLEPTPIPLSCCASNELAVSEYNSSIYTIYSGELHRIREFWNGSAIVWQDESWPLPSSAYSRVKVGGSFGKVILYGEALAQVTFTGPEQEEAVFTPIADTDGANNVAIAQDGTLEWIRLAGSPLTATLVVMHPDSGGYTTETFPAGSAWGTIATAVSADGSRFVASDSAGSSFIVFDDGEEVGKVSQPTTANDVAISPDGTTYVSWRNGKVFELGQAGVSPTVTAQPGDVAVKLAAADGSETVSFHAAATGEPAPTIQWQSKAPGAIGWSPIGGATAETLSVDATQAMAGTRYRAVFANDAGSIASETATLRVTTSTVDPPAGGGGDTGGGSSGTTKTETTPTGTTTTATAPFKLATASKVTFAGGGNVATVAKVTCQGTNACTVKAPAKVKLKVGKHVYTATVSVPKRIAPGATGAVKLKVGAKVRAALAGKQAQARFQLRVSSAGTTRTTTVHPTLVFREKKTS